MVRSGLSTPVTVMVPLILVSENTPPASIGIVRVISWVCACAIPVVRSMMVTRLNNAVRRDAPAVRMGNLFLIRVLRAARAVWLVLVMGVSLLGRYRVLKNRVAA